MTDSCARELLGAPVASSLCERLAPRVVALTGAGVTPKLAVVRVGEDAGSAAYERAARSRMAKLGIGCETLELPATAGQEALEGALRGLAGDPSVHGILLMRPLPAQLDESAAAACVPPEKDVDGMTEGSLARLLTGTGAGHCPCTPEAVMALLTHYEVPLAGRRVVAAETRRAEVLVSCMGMARAVTADMVRGGAAVVDVGTNPDGKGGIVGDVDHDSVRRVVSAITPVPRGVGSVTTSVLALHVVEAAERTLL